MDLFRSNEIGDLLSLSQIGLWKVEFEEGKPPRFYADKIMNELLGTPEEMSPEDRFAFHHRRIHLEDLQLFEEYSDKLAADDAEITYRYIHPIKGEMLVRCGGKRDAKATDYVCIIGTHQNISETIRLEKDKVAERRLAEATKKAQAANKAKTSFLFNMSHDIRTPMNAIMGFTDLIEKNIDNPELCRNYLMKVRNSSDFLLSLINNVLEMARIESGKMILDETTLEVESFLDTLFMVFEQTMRDKGIEFVKEINVTHHYVFCDPVKLREVYLNILSNAVKYTPNGGRITMSVTEIPSQREDYAQFHIAISDTGIGMSKEYLPTLFEEFSRERNQTESKIEGTGLGLAIAKKLLELMEGNISVESTLGEGTTFYINISHRISSEAAMKKDCEKEKVTAEFAGRRILLAEDNDLNAEIAISILEEAGFEVDLAEDGVICVDKLLKAEPGYYDMIIMDIQMPNLNGYEATKRIRALADEERASIPIVAMTANAFAVDRNEAFDSGMNAYLTKPIRVNELMNTMLELFE